MNFIFLGLQEVTEQCASHNQTHGSSLLTGCDGVLSGGVSLAEAHICYCCLSGVWPSSPSSRALGILLRESTTLHGVQCTHSRSRVGVGVGVPAVSVGVHNRMCVGLRNKERSLPLTRADEVPRRLPTAGFTPPREKQHSRGGFCSLKLRKQLERLWTGAVSLRTCGPAVTEVLFIPEMLHGVS